MLVIDRVTQREGSSVAINYSVEGFGPEVETAYRRLFPDAADGCSAAQRRWRFEQGPHGPSMFALARDDQDGRIVGMIALFNTLLRRGARLFPAFQAIDTVVDPAYRGKSVFVGLGEIAHDTARHGGMIVWGFPNANAAPGWFGRLGWQNFGTVPFMVRALRSGYLLGKLVPFLARIDLPFVSQAPRSASPAHRLIDRFGPEADELWAASGLRETITVERDADWLNWRLFDKPGASYRTIGSFANGRLEAFVSTCILEKHGARICYVMEAIGRADAPRSLSRLLREEVAKAARLGADIALAWCPETAVNRPALRHAGFHHFPDRLRPIAIHFGARSLVGDDIAQMRNSSEWYLSYLDSDTV